MFHMICIFLKCKYKINTFFCNANTMEHLGGHCLLSIPSKSGSINLYIFYRINRFISKFMGYQMVNRVRFKSRSLAFY